MSRADALRAFFELGEGGVAGPAKALGFTWTEPMPEASPPREDAPTAEVRAREPAPAPQEPLQLAPISYWRPVSAVRADEKESERKNLKKSKDEPILASDLRSSGAPPAPPPIVSEPRLRRRLDLALRTPRPGADLDVDALVEQLARGQLAGELPRRVGHTQARLVLVLDPSPRLVPFWNDQLEVTLTLVRRLGGDRVRQLPPPDGQRDALSPDIAPDEIVLALSDLGFYGRSEDRERWVRYGRRLRAAGARLRALVPCPAWRWRGPGARLWQAIDWSAPEGAGRLRRPASLTKAPVADPAEALMRLLAPAVRVEPGLLRAVRRLLGESADLGTEADVWCHAEVDGASPCNLEIDPRQRVALTAETLEDGWDPKLVAQAARTILEWHSRRAGVLWASELAHLRACGVPDADLGAERVAEAEGILARSVASAATAGPAGQRAADRLQAYLKREIGRVPARQATDPRFGKMLVRTVRLLRKLDPKTPLPAGVTSEMIRGEESAQPLRHFAVYQLADRLRVQSREEAGAGSLIATLSARGPLLAVSDGRQSPVELPLDQTPAEIPWPEVGGPLELVTDQESVRLEAWAPPAWACSSGRDGFGLWASFEVDGVEQRLRWIPPGRFEMGSPESESGRLEREGPAHPAVLTEGYWLAETPCTQELWLAVMGGDAENPSYFPSSHRPVEQVSWDDCQRFIDRLNFRFRDLELRMPTETEWEYACRAGSGAATWRGDLNILGGHNAPILDEIAWYGGNSGVDYDLEQGFDSSGWPGKQYPHSKAGTREVARKIASPWGLHDMLGNVDEWCWDSYASYRDGLVVDPEGPEEGAYRVIRGGSWLDSARYVRAAYRRGDGPGIRESSLGFRLSRGPRDRGAVRPEAGEAVSEAVRRGTSRRARSRREYSWVDRLEWAVDGGLDGYGRWAEFEAAGVRHRLRWMFPGRFQMGSPDDEVGRWDDEGPRHDVTLTEGFWLADLPCTQELWQAVMGKNPSYFKSPKRPVEQVSWEDCQQFFEQLNRQVPSLQARIPTEAQWEYACRAGAATATWLGDLEILGVMNAPRLDPIAWYGGNCGVGFDLSGGFDSSGWEEKQFPHTQAGTREVGLKRPNPWGLHDMLGNVFEWCADQWDYESGYPGGPRVDPVSRGGAYRVFRGGSWRVHARYVRAAYRYGDEPGYRESYLGFRLSRGPQETGRAEPEGENGGQGAASRGTRRRAPGRWGWFRKKG